MDISTKKVLKKTTTTQFEVLVKQLEAHPDLARGAPVYGSDRSSMEELWKMIASKVNSYGPPQRSVIEWKKIWADLKSRTKKKIAENNRSLNATGGGPFESSQLTEIEQVIDRILLMSRSAAPSGLVLGTKRQQTAVQSTKTVAQTASTTTQIAEQQPEAASEPATTTTPTRRRDSEFSAPTPTITTSNIGVVTPTVAPRIPRLEHTRVSVHTLKGPRYVPRKRNFKEGIAESAKEQAKAARLQAEACREMANSSQIQAESTKAISEALIELVALTKRQTEAFEEFLQVMKNT